MSTSSSSLSTLARTVQKKKPSQTSLNSYVIERIDPFTEKYSGVVDFMRQAIVQYEQQEVESDAELKKLKKNTFVSVLLMVQREIKRHAIPDEYIGVQNKHKRAIDEENLNISSRLSHSARNLKMVSASARNTTRNMGFLRSIRENHFVFLDFWS